MSEPMRSQASRVTRVVVAVLVVVVVVAGIWISGGLLTNDFGLAMALTAVWMGVAGLGCVLIAWRRRDIRVPVMGAYLVTALVVGGYLGRSQFLDDKANEQVVTAAPPPAPSEPKDRTRNVLLARGRFQPLAHAATGVASTIRTNGGNVLTLSSFEVDNGPDLRVYLVAGPARSESEVKQFRDLGRLKGNKGNQQYRIPAGVDLDRYKTVVIWCRAFSVNFARAPLR